MHCTYPDLSVMRSGNLRGTGLRAFMLHEGEMSAFLNVLTESWTKALRQIQGAAIFRRLELEHVIGSMQTQVDDRFSGPSRVCCNHYSIALHNSCGHTSHPHSTDHITLEHLHTNSKVPYKESDVLEKMGVDGDIREGMLQILCARCADCSSAVAPGLCASRACAASACAEGLLSAGARRLPPGLPVGGGWLPEKLASSPCSNLQWSSLANHRSITPHTLLRRCSPSLVCVYVVRSVTLLKRTLSWSRGGKPGRPPCHAVQIRSDHITSLPATPG